MNVGEIMNTQPAIVAGNTSIMEASSIMAREGIGFLVVGAPDKLEGVVTDRDIVVKGLAKQLDPRETAISEIYSTELHHCYESQDVEEALETMSRQQVKRVPVLSSEERLVGVVSLRDLAQNLDPGKAGKLLECITEEQAGSRPGDSQ